MRKKHDEGYALVFVLVVMVVLSLIAISLMTAALKNLQNQKATVAQMEAKYEAQGEVEREVAQIEALIAAYASNDAKKEHNEYVYSTQNELESLLSQYTLAWATDESRSCTLKLTASSESENGQTVQVAATIELVDVVGEETKDGSTFHVVVKPTAVKYVAYTVDYLSPSEPEEGGDA